VNRVFLLSPANLSGVRARIIMNENAGFELAVRLRENGAPLGDVFAFISGLYFRGKFAYSKAFGIPLVITAGRGLLPPDTVITLGDLHEIAQIPIDLHEPRYRSTLERDALLLTHPEIILLGSIATPKYVEPLKNILGSRLFFPSEFAGLGDMSRGGLMLRCVREARELAYSPASVLIHKKKRVK
jgi:hypothetical protein